MRASMKTYAKVAEQCNSFSPIDENTTTTNSTFDHSDVSCTTCKHFTQDKYCELDLYDEIISKSNITE